ncbi:MAG: hypothetical protein HDR46_01915 [Bacteroides sp.]|nr:hypothetical protein [Bacteroides sp.]MBD5415021.1 hypothetical protein [Bacteroides sp.]
MRIAIHHKDNGFAPQWEAYCRQNNIDYKLVNCYDSDIVDQVKDCDIIMWHHHHADLRDILIARQILNALEAAGKTVFPNHSTAWHFDDKVGQKYLFEALNLPAAPAHVFVEKKAALKWADETTFPKVFKLRGGAGSSNVKLIRTKKQAIREIKRCFGRGYAPFSRWEYCRERIRKWREGRDSVSGALKGIGRLFITPKGERLKSQERGYAYFQDFMPDNNCDTRIAVIGEKYAMAFRRGVRNGDFRASGSGNIIYDGIDPRMVSLAFNAANKIHSQSLALDFILDQKGDPVIVEVSFGFVPEAIDKCDGYWSSDLVFHKSDVNVCAMQVEAAIEEAKSKKK